MSSWTVSGVKCCDGFVWFVETEMVVKGSFIALAVLLAANPAFAEVDPKIHKLCVEAKDYAGCVRAMKGDTTPVTETRMRMGL